MPRAITLMKNKDKKQYDLSGLQKPFATESYEIASKSLSGQTYKLSETLVSVVQRATNYKKQF